MLSLDKVIDLIAAFMRDEKIDVFAVEVGDDYAHFISDDVILHIQENRITFQSAATNDEWQEIGSGGEIITPGTWYLHDHQDTEAGCCAIVPFPGVRGTGNLYGPFGSKEEAEAYFREEVMV